MGRVNSIVTEERTYRDNLYWEEIVLRYGEMRNCPRFSHCSVPICPLDLDKALRSKLPDEPDCPL